MPTFVAHLGRKANTSMVELYNKYKQGESIDDCWNVTVEKDKDFEKGSYYIEHPIQLEECPIFESGDYNVDTIDKISSFCVIENPNSCICFDRCKSNKYFECFSLSEKESFQWKKKT